MTDQTELEKIALEVANEAATLVLEGFQKRFQVSTKGPHAELFTEYDLRSEELVRERLRQLTPGIPIVGEEQGGEPGPDITWYVDPIDGTINFIAGHPYFAVSVGAMRGSQPIAGAVVAPALNVHWSGTAEFGSSKGEQPCHVSRVTTLADAVVSTGFPSRRGVPLAVADRRLAEYGRLCSAVRDIRRCGSAAIDLCFVADGTYAAYWMRELSRWDTAAGAAIVLGAGGSWHTHQPGTPQAYSLASNGQLQAAFLQTLVG